MDTTKRFVWLNYKKVQTLFECTNWTSKISFFRFYLHGINQTVCHKYVKASRGSVSSPARCLQTMADGSRLRDRVTN